MKLGSLFSGFGGLDLAVEAVFGATTVWVSDIEPGPRKVLAHRYPGVPNLGDITTVDWSQVEPVDIIAGGSPCQDISAAGRMAGMRDGTRSNLWVAMRDAIASLQPSYVIWENVYAARSTAAASAMESDPRLLGDHPNGQPVLRALGRVLGDLASLGFDAEWHSLRAADVGAPHGRARYFVVAAHPERVARGEWRFATAGQSAGGRPFGATARCDRAPVTLLPTPSAGNFNDGEDPDQWEARRQRVKANNGNGVGMPLGIAVQLLPTPTVRDHKGRNQRNDDTCLTGALLPTPRATDGTKGGPNQRGSSGDLMLPSAVMQLLPTPMVGSSSPAAHGQISGQYRAAMAEALTKWGNYAAAIARWEAIIGPAPAPTKPGRNRRPKLNPAFAEWMMGAPPGWITDVPGVTDNEALRMAGNGVVVAQCVEALRVCIARSLDWSA